MKTKIIILILAVFLLTITTVSAQLVFSTTADNADNTGAHVADNDMGTDVCSADPNQPIEFYINQGVSPATMLNATLDLYGFSTQFCGDTNTVKVNGNTVGSFASCTHQDYIFNISPSLLVNGDNFVQVNISSIQSTHCAQVINGSLIIFNSTLLDPNGDADGDGMTNGYEMAHTCLNPLVNDANIDSDNDSIIVRYQNNSVYQNISMTNIQEMNMGTEPCKNDTDADGFKDGLELYLGTNATAKCSITTIQNDEPIDAWPVDANDDQLVNWADLLKFKQFFGSRIGNSTWDKRFDWNADGTISALDILKLKMFYNKNCTQI
ncbi:MAG: hypothetical protein EPN86_02535 [Nanoarchaeota archaeon]|nr:MAG: hypothetical protein EPN86_02535 [Nanoarchaeota archaeon]